MKPTQVLHTPWNFTPFVREAQREGFLPDIPIMESPANAIIRWENKNIVNFAGINFLGLHNDPQMLTHFLQSTQTYGWTTGGSRITQGVCRPHYEVEQLFSQITGKERAITFASGLLANLGFCHGMSARFFKNTTCQIDNSDTHFILDRDSHWSLRKAVERFTRGDQRFYFDHNDPTDLQQVLAKINGKKVAIFESVYSVDGSVAPIGELIDVCEQYEAISYVDDANGFLIYGPSHRPFAHEFAHLSRATFVMASFSKAVGLDGGVIAGPEDAIRAFELLAGTSMFTSAIQPPTASTIHAIMRHLLEYPVLMDQYLEKVERFRHQLKRIGCQLNETPTYIISILVGADEKLEPLRKEFLNQGYLVPVLHYPVVKFNGALIRVMLNWHHTDEQIDGFVKTLTELKSKYEF